MGKLPLSYAWVKAHTAADRQLSVCMCENKGKGWVRVYVCVFLSTSIFAGAILSFRL